MRLFAALVMLVTVAACASPKYVVSDVTRFHTLGGPSGESFAGKTFAIVAVSPEQEQSIAYRQFGDQLNARLSSLGMRQFQGASPSGADYVVTLDYDVLGPTPDVRSRGSNFSVGFGYSNFRRPWGYGLGYDPFWDDHHYTDTRQLFTRRVELMMYRGSTYTNGPKQRVFEGRAVSMGQSGQIEPVMPFMLDAVLMDFPGPSGRTGTVTVQVPDDVDQPERRTRPNARSAY
jgi:hypothetical protein